MHVVEKSGERIRAVHGLSIENKYLPNVIVGRGVKNEMMPSYMSRGGGVVHLSVHENIVHLGFGRMGCG